MNDTPNMMFAALQYGYQGFRVIPLHTIIEDSLGKRCSCKDGFACKRPGKHPRILNWQEEATADPDKIMAFWKKFPQSNIGILTGATSCILVIDVDLKNGKDGFFSLEDLFKEYTPWPETASVETGSGGRHYYFRCQGHKVQSLTNIRVGIDTRGEGGFIIAPPSIHISGKPYKWLLEPREGCIADAPEWLIKLLQNPHEKHKYNSEPILEGTRNSTLTSLAGKLRRQGFGKELILATLKSVNAQQCNPPLDESEVEQIASSVSKYEASPLYSSENIIHALATPGKARKPNEIAAEIISSKKILTDKFDNTYEYQEGMWNPLAPWILESLCCKYDAAEHTTAKRCRETAYYVKNYTRKDDFKWNDIKRGEVPLKNGVFDVFTGKLRPHRPEDYLEAVFPIEYDPDAKCPLFDTFLEQAIGDDPRKVLAVEEMIGYLLMLEAPYKTAFICHGPSDTGKTVLQGVMIDLVGKDKVCQIALDKLHDPSEIAPIKAKALNAVSELKYKSLVSDDGFKRLVSTGEPVQLNQKYLNRETYVPHCKHAVFTNELPHVTDLTEAVYRRLLIVSFPHVVPKEEQDSKLGDKLKLEQPGILLRALSGLKRLIDNEGQFTLPEDHQKWVQEIKEDSNPLNEILAGYFVKDAAGYTSMADVREIVRGKCPHMKGYRDKRITQLLKATGAEVKETSRDGIKGTFLLGYNLTPQIFHWFQYSRHQTPITGYIDPIQKSMG